MKKHNIATVLLFVCLLCTFLIGCAQSDETKDDAKRWRKKAEELAIQHIEEKYGFTPTVIDCKSNRGDSVTPPNSYIPQTIITMSADDKTFTVIADGDEDSIDHVWDNYQEEEIIDAVTEYLSKCFQVPVYDVMLKAGHYVTLPEKDFAIQYNLFHDYFEKDDLQDYITQRAFTAHVKLVGDINLDDLTMLSQDSIVFDSKSEFLITVHDSENDADICTLESYFDKTVYRYAMYISDAVEVKKGKINEYELSIKQYEDIYYFCPDEKNLELTLKEDIYSESDWAYASHNYLQISGNAYYISDTISNSTSEVYIYYPVELLRDPFDSSDDYCLGEAYYKSEYDKYMYERHKGTLVNEYQVFGTSLKGKEEVSFRLLSEIE